MLCPLNYLFSTAEPDDILDLSELGEPNPPSVIIPTLRPVDEHPIIIEPIIDLPVAIAYRKRRSIFGGIHVHEWDYFTIS